MVQVDCAAVGRAANERPTYVRYLEGLRGCAAFYVVLYHVIDHTERNKSGVAFAKLLPFHGSWLLFGHASVGIFIVISGYVLTLPVVTRGSLAGGAMGFFRRRSRRLLPAYYAALALSLPFFVLNRDFAGQSTSPAEVAGQLAAHAVLLQDLSERFIYAFNGPLWSISVECQIYLAFVVLLLPLRARFGLLAMIAVGFAIGFVPTVLNALHPRGPHDALDDACLWYLGLFALGSGAAALAHEPSTRYAWLRDRMPWTALTVICAAVYLALELPRTNEPPARQYLPDVALGLAVASGFLMLARQKRLGVPSIPMRVLESKPCMALGGFSYSLYLTHEPMLRAAGSAVSRTALPDAAVLATMYALVLPALLFVAYAFSLMFERPFMGPRPHRASASHRRVSLTHTESVAIASPQAPAAEHVAGSAFQ